MTTGVISATGRSDVGIADFEDFLQTDAPINPGNGVVPLIDVRRRSHRHEQCHCLQHGAICGRGFCHSFEPDQNHAADIDQGRPQSTRGLLGVSIQNVTKELGEQFHVPGNKGALISQVNKGSAAEKAGLKPGDVGDLLPSKAVSDSGQLRNLVAATAPRHARSPIEVIRNGKHETTERNHRHPPRQPWPAPNRRTKARNRWICSV